MEHLALAAIPRRALRRLEFLVGEFSGEQTLYPPDRPRLRCRAFCTGSREACERYTKIEFFADVPKLGVESHTAFLTYSRNKEAYEMWVFSSSSEEPLHMLGEFNGDRLVLISDPWQMPWGLQRLRGTFIPLGNGDFRYESELWEPDGFTLFRSTAFRRRNPEG